METSAPGNSRGADDGATNFRCKDRAVPLAVDGPGGGCDRVGAAGAGYQFAVTDNPVTKNNWVITSRVTF
jgi:hypothetical protein